MVSPKHNSVLNAAHERRILAHLGHADKLLSDIEGILNAASSKSPFPKYRPDVGLLESRIVQDYLARIRSQMLRVLDGTAIQPGAPELSARHAIRVTLAFVRVALQEITPACLAGCGAIPESLIPELEGLSAELQGLVDKLGAFLARERGDDFERKLAALRDDSEDVRLARELGRMITEHGLVELRPALSTLVNRLGVSRFEIAVFGPVSSGKSSLLNHILGAEVLPVGVKPITAVPARLIWGAEARLTVSFAHRETATFELERLGEFGTERGNPNNEKAVTGIVAEYPADRLGEGVAFVDTPGLGSRATAGAAESAAYLPQCDLGVVLINATATLTGEELVTIRSLREAGIPALAVLSKADLLGRGDREAALEYVREEIRSATGETIPVDLVSVVGADGQLLETWFERRIAPLCEKSRQLGAESLRWKLAALRASVEAALRTKAGHQGPDDSRLARWKECERRLRAAEGSIAETERAGRGFADHADTMAREAIDRAAVVLLDRWRAKQSTADDAALVRQSVSEQAGAAARRIREELEDLAQRLQDALRLVSAELQTDDLPAWDDLDATLREVPRIDLDLETLAAPHRFGLLLPDRLARAWIVARLRRTAGPVIDHALRAYRDVLGAWARRRIAEMRDRFQRHADAYRAQLDRLIRRPGVTPEEGEAAERDLEAIAALGRRAIAPAPAGEGLWDRKEWSRGRPA